MHLKVMEFVHTVLVATKHLISIIVYLLLTIFMLIRFFFFFLFTLEINSNFLR